MEWQDVDEDVDGVRSCGMWIILDEERLRAYEK